MAAKDPFRQSERPSAIGAGRPNLRALQLRYFELQARLGAGLWSTAEGKELEFALERDDLWEEVGDYVFACPRTLCLYWDICDHLAVGDRHFLVLGERGAGKEVVARVIAKLRDKKLIAVNCATLIDTLAEAQLFGVSGQAGLANVPRDGTRGYVGEADGEVLFLDEFFDAPPSVHPKLLRLLQASRSYHRVGEPTERYLKEQTIIVAASNRFPDRRQLRSADAGQVRADLVDRFAAQLEVPPLRERKREIPAIARNIVQRLSGKGPLSSLDETTAETLRHHPHTWLGNVRELERLLASHLRLRRHQVVAAGGVDVRLVIPEEDLAGWLAATANAGGEAGRPARRSDGELSAWHDRGLRQIQEEQLLTYLCWRLTDEGRAAADVHWVAERCRSALRSSNISQRLRERLGKSCAEIAEEVNRLIAGFRP